MVASKAISLCGFGTTFDFGIVGWSEKTRLRTMFICDTRMPTGAVETLELPNKSSSPSPLVPYFDDENALLYLWAKVR